jgi:U3 small nucleolar ribonucleoprotein protein LCP5
MNKNLKQICPIIQSLIEKFKSDPDSYETEKGISFLSMKNMLMIEYLTNLLFVVHLKMSGHRMSGHKCVERLAELRCVLEKTKSIELKLKYQIDKLLKIAVSCNPNEHDPLSFKANVNNFAENKEDDGDDKMSQNDDDDDDDIIKRDKYGEDDGDFEEALAKKKSSGLYVAPRLAPMFNDIDETPQQRKHKQLERAKKRAINSSIMKELENEYSGAPEEIKDTFANTIEVETTESKHKRDYEEENFMRKPLTKVEVKRAKRLQHGTNLNSLTSFEDARILLDENINAEDFLS